MPFNNCTFFDGSTMACRSCGLYCYDSSRGRVCLNKIVSQAKTASGFIVFLFLLQCLFNRTGNALIEIGRFTMVTDKGIITAAILALRLLIFLLSALILFTGEARDYLLALIQCRIPYEIAFMVMIGIHFFPILREEAFNVYCSAQLRGTEIKKASLSHAFLLTCIFACRFWWVRSNEPNRCPLPWKQNASALFGENISAQAYACDERQSMPGLVSSRYGGRFFLLIPGMIADNLPNCDYLIKIKSRVIVL